MSPKILKQSPLRKTKSARNSPAPARIGDVSLKGCGIETILVVSLAGAGDTLMATSLITELRRNYPNALIDVLVQHGAITKDLLKHNPSINKIQNFNFLEQTLLSSLIFIAKLRKSCYHLSINAYPQARHHYSLVAYLIRARFRIGFNYDSQTCRLGRLFFHALINEDRHKHVIENNLKVLSVLNLSKPQSPSITYSFSARNAEFADTFFNDHHITNSVVIHPGGGTQKNFWAKRWPQERFAILARCINRKYAATIIVAGGGDETQIKENIITHSQLTIGSEIINLNTDINNTAAVLKRSALVIANDSIIAHLAGAVGTYVIGLFGPSDEFHTGPFTRKASLLSKRPSTVAPYQHGSKGMTKIQADTIKLISIDDVLNEVGKVLL